MHSSRQIISNLSYIEGITLDVDEVYEIAGRTSDMGLDGINEVGNRASEGQNTGVYVISFAVRFLARYSQG